ncbi:hypothetical protein FACS1894167_14940 [Synergistales bacterium]|nr:hypothetical protein FACS1894167_14940 [Synergistales bacterium]
MAEKLDKTPKVKYIDAIKTNYQQMIFVVAAFVLLTVINCLFVDDIVTKQTDIYGESVISSLQALILTRMQTNEIALRDVSLAIFDEVKKGASADELKRIIMLWSKSFENRKEINSSFLGIYAYFDGHFLSGVGWVAPADYDPVSRPWYKGAVEKKGEIYYTEPYADAMTEKIIGTISRTISDENGQMRGVICVDFYFTPIVEMVRAVNIRGAGFGMMMDSSLRVISHPNADFEGKNLGELAGYSKVYESLTATDSDSLTIRFAGALLPGESGESLIGFFSRMFNGWHVGTIVPTQYFYKDIYTMLPILILFSVSFMLVLCLLLLRLNVSKMRSDEANKSKSVFLARMSHEIRTPMNAVIGMSELALRIEGMPRPAAEYIIGIKQAGQNLLSIINDILDFSRIESDNLEITPSPYMYSPRLSIRWWTAIFLWRSSRTPPKRTYCFMTNGRFTRSPSSSP